MHVTLAVHLPREASTVPTARRLCRMTLQSLEVTAENADDILLALTEACANVIEHATAGHGYDVSLRIDGESCTLRVTDSGTGSESFDGVADPPTDGDDDLAALLPHGRGLALMAALMDTMRFQPVEGGTSVELVKRLDLSPGSPLALMAASRD